MTQGEVQVAYEQPLHERVRMFLRLEFLFSIYRHHRADHSSYGVRSTLHALLDILSLSGRSDLKTEVVKELTEQHDALIRLQSKPGVDPGRLDSVLREINDAMNAMQTLTAHAIATTLRDNEFLSTMVNRSTIPGGTCGFDLPYLQCWLSQPYDTIRRDLDAWFADLNPYEKAVNLYLRLLRNSTEPIPEVAKGGMFVHAPPSQFLLLRVILPAQLSIYPEISAGRHRFTVRMMHQRDVNIRAHQATEDVPFLLQCCLL